MNLDHIGLIREFLDSVGIPATVETTEGNAYRITVSSSAYEQRRAYINAWFTPLAREDDSIILMERLRGTGNTD